MRKAKYKTTHFSVGLESPIEITISNKTNRALKNVEVVSPSLLHKILSNTHINNQIEYSVLYERVPLYLFAMDLIRNEYNIGLIYLNCKSKTTILSGFNLKQTSIIGNESQRPIKSKFYRNQLDKTIVEIYTMFKLSYNTTLTLNKLSPKTTIILSLYPIPENNA